MSKQAHRKGGEKKKRSYKGGEKGREKKIAHSAFGVCLVGRTTKERKGPVKKRKRGGKKARSFRTPVFKEYSTRSQPGEKKIEKKEEGEGHLPAARRSIPDNRKEEGGRGSAKEKEKEREEGEYVGCGLLTVQLGNLFHALGEKEEEKFLEEKKKKRGKKVKPWSAKRITCHRGHFLPKGKGKRGGKRRFQKEKKEGSSCAIDTGLIQGPGGSREGEEKKRWGEERGGRGESSAPLPFPFFAAF